MGRYWPNNVYSRKDLIALLTADSVIDYPSGGKDFTDKRVVLKTIAKCFRGRICGVLWSVVERWVTEGDGEPRMETRYIKCDLIRHDKDGWYYTPMRSACQPYQYSCPEKYLELTEDYLSDCNPTWRALVREWHTERRERLAAKRGLLKAKG